jgi:hypothetical protein
MDFSSLASQFPKSETKPKTEFTNIKTIFDLYTIQELRIIAEKLQLNRLYGKRAGNEAVSITAMTKSVLIDLLAEFYSIEIISDDGVSSGTQINNDAILPKFSLDKLRELVKVIGKSGVIKIKGLSKQELIDKLKPIVKFYLIENIDKKTQTYDELKKRDETVELDLEDDDPIITVINKLTKADIMEAQTKQGIIENIKSKLNDALGIILYGSFTKIRSISDPIGTKIADKYFNVFEKLSAENPSIAEDKRYELAGKETKRYVKLIIRELPKLIDIKNIRKTKLDTQLDTTQLLENIQSIKLGTKAETLIKNTKEGKAKLNEPKKERGRPKVDKSLYIAPDIPKRKYVKQADKDMDIKSYNDLITYLGTVLNQVKRGDILKIKLKEPIKHPKIYSTFQKFVLYWNRVRQPDETELRDELLNYWNEFQKFDLEKEDRDREWNIKSILLYLGQLINIFNELPEKQKVAEAKSVADKDAEKLAKVIAKAKSLKKKQVA